MLMWYIEKSENRAEDDGILPDVRPELETFRKVITWKTIGKKRFPEPTKGLSSDFDEANASVEQLKTDIKNCLDKARKAVKNKTMKFNETSKIYKFEFELPLEKMDTLPSEFYVTSKTYKSVRFINDELKKLMEDLEEAEIALQDAISPFLAKLFRKFYKKQYLWSDFVSCIAELDCLISLAIVSKLEDDMVKPVVIPRSCDASDRPILELQGVKHPCVSKMLKGDFIPNNVSLGGDSPLVNIITGPNMGGKSTLLRQTCIAIIMCQIGCFVPASSCRMTLFDRIFTRIGASDRILENKSTFFVEMEETKTIVEQSTPYSLVIMDELGRGTSTFDGYSIAHAVLSYQVKQNQCLTLFTTHYHMLVDSFKDEAEVENYKMSFEVDPETHDVTFLYKFEKGYAKESQGIYVAKMAKIPLSICERAKVKCDEFRKTIEELEQKSKFKSAKKRKN